MDNQNEALDFKYKVYQNNRQFIFEAIKQVESKAYINLTLSVLLLGLIINFITKIEIDYPLDKIKIVGNYGTLAFIVLSLLIGFFSILSLHTSNLNKFLSYNFITPETINNPLILKANIVMEIAENYKDMLDLYNTKEKNLTISTNLLVAEIFFIMGLITSFFILILKAL